jgi:hypothetical protein
MRPATRLLGRARISVEDDDEKAVGGGMVWQKSVNNERLKTRAKKTFS